MPVISPTGVPASAPWKVTLNKPRDVPSGPDVDVWRAVTATFPDPMLAKPSSADCTAAAVGEVTVNPETVSVRDDVV